MKQDMTTRGETRQHLQELHSQLAIRLDEAPIHCPTCKISEQFAYDGLYRIYTTSCASTNVQRDIILCCQTLSGKQRLLHALKGKTPLQFENHSLAFFEDLNKATLLWRKSMRHTTQALQEAGITYRWTYPRSLTVTTDRKIYKAKSPPEGLNILQALGLSETQPASHTWDVSRIAPFVPGGTVNSVT
ncbi:Hypothetical predicted protein [Pelobates cultripes]|uniref:Uncharacterized protein n=1 Tax=Pelobates cultripes TaxID=61616 RepID=A0AAD1TCM5_PELCU|nr:Hypothetical predicted protein [Pelobates cultripes]